MSSQPTPSQDPPHTEVPAELPLLPVRDIVVFPYMVLPLFVGRDVSIKAIEAALEQHRMIFLTTQKTTKLISPNLRTSILSGQRASSCAC